MNKELKIYTADLHIHTPASKCYEEKQIEYIEILKVAKKKELNIIAISDHNSIEGYSYLIEQKKKIQTEIETLTKLNDSVQANKQIKELERNLSFFDNILILPAIEFEVNNGIHMLVIFNPNTPLNKINSFLEEGGYDRDSFGFEKSDTISNWSIFDLYDEVKKYDCIVIDGHTDSDKGIWNTIPNGNTRAHSLKSTSLSGVCYNNERQRKQIENILRTSPEYHRDRPLAFIKASDAHNLQDIGKSKSFFKLEQLDWNCFKNSFENPSEYIFTNRPEVQSIIKGILDKENCLTIPKIDEENVEQFLKSICALNNTNGGYILIGVDNKNTILGLEIKDDNFDNFEPYFKMLIDGSRRISNNYKSDFNVYPLMNEKLILVFKIFKNDRIIDIDKNGIIYSFSNNSISILSADKIQKTIENNTIKDIEKRILKNLKVIEEHTSKVKTSLKSLPIISTFIESSISIHSIIKEPKVITPYKLNFNEQKALIEYGEKNGNGRSKGNIFYFEEEFSPRLKDAYLRYSIPKYYSKNLNFESKNEETLYLVPGGALFISKRTLPQYNIKGYPILEIQIDERNEYSLKFLCSYLKSSFALWFFISKYDNIDIYEPDIFSNLMIPKLNFKNPKVKEIVDNIENEFDNIIQCETEFLKLKLNEDNFEDEVIKHNSKIDSYAICIDKNIYSLLNLDITTQEIIESTLKANQIHYPINN
jgi:NifU-like protein involved in Fe-S cluster formation